MRKSILLYSKGSVVKIVLKTTVIKHMGGGDDDDSGGSGRDQNSSDFPSLEIYSFQMKRIVVKRENRDRFKDSVGVSLMKIQMD